MPVKGQKVTRRLPRRIRRLQHRNFAKIMWRATYGDNPIRPEDEEENNLRTDEKGQDGPTDSGPEVVSHTDEGDGDNPISTVDSPD